MQLVTTPVNDPTAEKVTPAVDSTIIKRPSEGKQRRVSAPIKDVPETRIAPEQIMNAPRADRFREIDFFERDDESKMPQTPRRRSTQLVHSQKTPDASIPDMKMVSSAPNCFGFLAPHRSQRLETRVLLKEQNIMPLF